MEKSEKGRFYGLGKEISIWSTTFWGQLIINLLVAIVIVTIVIIFFPKYDIEGITGVILLQFLFYSLKSVFKRYNQKRLENIYPTNKIRKFDPKNFLREISKSHREIKILETFLESLLNDKSEFSDGLIKFVKNCARKKSKGKIQILLIDPQSKHTDERLDELFEHYQKSIPDRYKNKDEFKNYFRHQMFKWIEGLYDTRDFVLKLAERAKADVYFEIKIYDQRPPFSLYLSDSKAYFGYYRDNIPTTESDQFVFKNLESGIVKFQLETFEGIWNNKNLIKGIGKTDKIDDFLKNFIPINNTIIDKFKSLTYINDEKEIYKILKELRPDNISKDELFSLVKYLELEYRYNLEPKPHYNIFGTGGDPKSKKTINISTISSILASHFELKNKKIVVKKLGTLGVTSKVGSQQFYSHLCSILIDQSNEFNIPQQFIPFANFNPPSDYIYTLELRYKYRNELRSVRNKLFNENVLDIYKVLFPVANFTGSDAQVNGVSNQLYLKYYKSIFSKFKKSGIIIYNESGVDELIRGKNTCEIFYKGENIEHYPVYLPEDMSENEYWEYFSETKTEDDAEPHVKKFFDLFNPKTHKDIKMTICYNVATILKLPYLEDDDIKIDDLAIQVYDKFFSENSIVLKHNGEV